MNAASNEAQAAEAAPAASPAPEKAPPFGQNALKVQVAQLVEHVQRQEKALAELTAIVGQQGQELSEARSQLSRLALAMGRQDLLTPPATIEQLHDAYKAGRSLLVLKDCNIPGQRFIAGTKIEARQYDLEKMATLIEQRHLAVAVVD